MLHSKPQISETARKREGWMFQLYKSTNIYILCRMYSADQTRLVDIGWARSLHGLSRPYSMCSWGGREGKDLGRSLFPIPRQFRLRHLLFLLAPRHCCVAPTLALDRVRVATDLSVKHLHSPHRTKACRAVSLYSSPTKYPCFLMVVHLNRYS